MFRLRYRHCLASRKSASVLCWFVLGASARVDLNMLLWAQGWYIIYVQVAPRHEHKTLGLYGRTRGPQSWLPTDVPFSLHAASRGMGVELMVGHTGHCIQLLHYNGNSGGDDHMLYPTSQNIVWRKSLHHCGTVNVQCKIWCFLDRLDVRYTFSRTHWFAEPGNMPGS